LASGDVTMYVEGIAVNPNLCIQCGCYDPSDNLPATAEVHIAVADITLSDAQGSDVAGVPCAYDLADVTDPASLDSQLHNVEFEAGVVGLPSSKIQQFALAAGGAQCTEAVVGTGAASAVATVRTVIQCGTAPNTSPLLRLEATSDLSLITVVNVPPLGTARFVTDHDSLAKNFVVTPPPPQGGRDITAALLGGWRDFDKLLSNATTYELRTLANDISLPLLFSRSWDISELHSAGEGSMGFCPSVPTPPAASVNYVDGTVTVDVCGHAGVYNAADVNYLLWGAFFAAYYERIAVLDNPGETPQLFYDTAVLAPIIAWGIPAHLIWGEGIGGRIAWAKAGFFGDLSAVLPYALNGTGPGQDPALLPSCQSYDSRLTFTINPDANLCVTYTGATVKVVSCELCGSDVEL
jgi:hypothetical protein